MSSYQELKKKFLEEVAELRAKCRHKVVSDWRKLYWAPGHPTFFEVKTCIRCEEVIAKRTRCCSCGEWVEKQNLIEGDGQEIPLGLYFCSQKCLEKYKKQGLG